MTEAAQPSGGRVRAPRPPLTPAQILAWADQHFAVCGRWPTVRSGAVPGQPGETWCGVDVALRHGRRGLPGGDSLSRLLTAHRSTARSPLPVADALRWADAFHARRGRWPTTACGRVCGAEGETWLGIDRALREQSRIACPHPSLRRLLEVERGARYPQKAWVLSPELILAWADGHFDRTGEWPAIRSGPIREAAGLSWWAVDSALRYGRHGLPGGSSLARLIRQFRPAPRTRPPVQVRSIPKPGQRPGTQHPPTTRQTRRDITHTGLG